MAGVECQRGNVPQAAGTRQPKFNRSSNQSGGFRSNANIFSTKPPEFVVVATVPKGTGLDTVVGLERASWFSTGGR